ncbi:hypothetical protein [Actinoplanes sp. G11-F43]|uniref:hypothetical protein n=1 Tax=Actinoplanes sp. G11-F43 TaxID=3424130 RepID=UPI003D339996
MSVLTDYFAAGSDDVAATAVDGEPRLLEFTAEQIAAGKELYRTSPEEASRPRVRIAPSGTPVVQSKGVDPTRLVSLEKILTGRSSGDRQAALIAPAEEDIDGCVVMAVTDTLRDALAVLEPEALPRVARQWATVEFEVSAADGLTEFLTALTDLARRAVPGGDRLYCLACF